MCCFLYPTSSAAYFSFLLCWFGLSLPMSPRITHVKAAYTDSLFFSHASVLIRLCYGFPQQWPQDWKRSVFIPISKKGNDKECSNYGTIALISHTSKVMLKILQSRLQQYVNRELPIVQAGFRKGRGTRDQIANICWIIEKAREFQKNIYF